MAQTREIIVQEINSVMFNYSLMVLIIHLVYRFIYRIRLRLGLRTHVCIAILPFSVVFVSVSQLAMTAKLFDNQITRCNNAHFAIRLQRLN